MQQIRPFTLDKLISSLERLQGNDLLKMFVMTPNDFSASFAASLVAYFWSIDTKVF